MWSPFSDLPVCLCSPTLLWKYFSVCKLFCALIWFLNSVENISLEEFSVLIGSLNDFSSWFSATAKLFGLECNFCSIIFTHVSASNRNKGSHGISTVMLSTPNVRGVIVEQGTCGGWSGGEWLSQQSQCFSLYKWWTTWLVFLGELRIRMWSCFGWLSKLTLWHWMDKSIAVY